MPRSPTRWCAALALTGACAQPPPSPPALTPRACERGLAGDWVRVVSARVDPQTRLRIEESGESWAATLLEGAHRVRLRGEVVGDTLRLDEGPAPTRRRYVRMRPESCALRMVEVAVGSDGVERQLPGGFVELMPYPGGAGLSWAMCEDTLALEPEGVQVVNGPFVVELRSAVASDGGARCVYDFDVYLDDHRVEALQAQPTQLRRGERHWTARLSIPYAGEHLVEIHRFRRCPGEERAPLGAACARVATH